MKNEGREIKQHKESDAEAHETDIYTKEKKLKIRVTKFEHFVLSCLVE